MEFIEQLPLSDGFTSILVVIDCLSKESVFIPTTNNAIVMDVADSFVTHVFAKHAPMEFTSHFFHSLASLLRMRHFTLGHHPSANGQVECINGALDN